MTQYVVRRGVVEPLRATRAPRVALVSVYGVPCGISTYSQALWSALHPHLEEGRVFAEREEGAAEIPGVERCWDRGQPLTELVQRIEEWDPDYVLVQHEYGYFPDARHWLSFVGAMSHRNVTVTLHSVYPHHKDKAIIEAACPKIVVHTTSAQQVLKSKGVTGHIAVIPHGCSLPQDQSRLWNMYHSEHTFMQFGFPLPYKGYSNALQVVKTLLPEHPDVFFTGLLSERWKGAHDRVVKDLNQQARDLGITEHVALLPGFQSDASLDAYLRTNRAALFPYRDNGQDTVHGCSGAARVAMAAGTPVVASRVPLFEDLDGVVARPSSVDGWAQALDESFTARLPQVEKQNQFLAGTSWDQAAHKYLDAMASFTGS
jgi:glycosyltransferase involved in cell wall biosynthesis